MYAYAFPFFSLVRSVSLYGSNKSAGGRTDGRTKVEPKALRDPSLSQFPAICFPLASHSGAEICQQARGVYSEC